MSIASAIQAAQQKIANAYAAISSKGGTLPATQDLANMPTAINSITTTNFTSLSVAPSTTAQTLTPVSPYNGFNQVDVSAVTSSIDANITAGNIKKDVQILGVTGTYEGSGGGSPSILPAELFVGDIDANGVYRPAGSSNTYVGNISLDGIKTISAPNALCYALNVSSGSSRPTARKIDGTITFPDLETLSGGSALYYMCNAQSQLTAAYFPKLQSVTGANALSATFNGCTNMAHIYFNALLPSSAVNSVARMTNMVRSVTGCTIHFPSNLQSIISSENNVVNGFGSTRTVILYDLPASSYNLTVNIAGSQQNMFNFITIGGVQYTSWSDFLNYTMIKNLPAGQYPFTVDVSGGAPVSPSSGTIDLTGGDVTLNINVGTASVNNVVFNVTSPMQPTYFDIDGQVAQNDIWRQSGSVYTATIPAADGSHSYSIRYFDATWAEHNETGSFTVNGSDVTITIPSS